MWAFVAISKGCWCAIAPAESRYVATPAVYAGEGDDGRLRELCMELLGQGQQAVSDEPGIHDWSPKICGLDKRKLLRDEVLKRLADKHLAIRRVKAEILDLLASVQDETEIS